MRKPTGICEVYADRTCDSVKANRVDAWFVDHKGKMVWAVYVAEEAIPKLHVTSGCVILSVMS